jgi:hypothetical protein
MANGYDSPIAGAFVMQGGYGLPFDRFPPSPQSGPKKLQHQVNCQKFFQKFHLPEAAVKKRQANTKKIEAEAQEAEASKCIDNVSNASTDHGSADSDKFALDGDSLDSFKSSLDSFQSSHADDAGIRHADDARILNQGVDQGFSVSIKNTFLDVSPKSMKKRPTGRLSKSLPCIWTQGSVGSKMDSTVDSIQLFVLNACMVILLNHDYRSWASSCFLGISLG